MSAHLDEQYFTWLYSQISSVKVRTKSQSHWNLARQLYTKEFVWFVPNDDNRVEDGRDLRHEFIGLLGVVEVDQEWLDLGCSMLEMLIGLSRRFAFVAEGDPQNWFWHMIDQLDLEKYNDRLYNAKAAEVIDDTLDRVIWRQYAPDGKGGLFPLQHPKCDQREVEIWYQFNAYLLEIM